MLKTAVLIAGPTASGKSRLATEIARETGGVIVNADSMQVYGVLRVLTARPSPAEEAEHPHRLFGHVYPGIFYSVASWLGDVEALIATGIFDTRPAIFVGGTGLYFRALTQGLSQMPEIPDDIRAKWRTALLDEGSDALHRQLAERDRRAAERLRPSDGQRIVRALEVLDASGRSILDWQGERGRPLVDPEAARKLVIAPERETLRQNIDARFDGMVEAGAIGEVEQLLALGLPTQMPAMKAIGVPELAAVLRDELAVDAAIERAKAATRQYAKRQDTWFRNQLGSDWERL